MYTPTLQAFKVRLEGALRNLVLWNMSLLMAGGWKLCDLWGLFQPKPWSCETLRDMVKWWGWQYQVYGCPQWSERSFPTKRILWLYDYYLIEFPPEIISRWKGIWGKVSWRSQRLNHLLPTGFFWREWSQKRSNWRRILLVMFSPEGDRDGLNIYICSFVTEISLEDMDFYLSLS